MPKIKVLLNICSCIAKHLNRRINKSSKSRRQTLIEIVKDRLEELVDLSKRSYRKLSKVEKTRRDRSEIWLMTDFTQIVRTTTHISKLCFILCSTVAQIIKKFGHSGFDRGQIKTHKKHSCSPISVIIFAPKFIFSGRGAKIRIWGENKF